MPHSLTRILDERMQLDPDRCTSSAVTFARRMSAISPDFDDPRGRTRCRRLLAQTVSIGRFTW